MTQPVTPNVNTMDFDQWQMINAKWQEMFYMMQMQQQNYQGLNP